MSAAPSSPAPAGPDSLPCRSALRRQLVAARLALAPEQVAALSQAICAHLLAGFPQLAQQVVGFCWPVHNEPDLRPALVDLARRGATPALPVVVKNAAPLAFRPWTPDTPLTPDRYGIPTPATGDWVAPSVLLLPVNGVDEKGYRLGYGGGYFDRTLAALVPRPLAIGVGFEQARVADIRPEAHDMPLDALVTEAGIFRFPPPRG